MAGLSFKVLIVSVLSPMDHRARVVTKRRFPMLSAFRPKMWMSFPEETPSFLRKVSVSKGMFLAVTSA